jgi:TonB family protein
MSRRWLVAVSVAAHLCLLTGVFVTGVWRIERADPGRRRTLDIGVQPLPPPAPAGGSFVPKIEIIPKAHVEVAKGPRQPTTKVETKPSDPGPQDPGPGSGAGSGSGDPRDTGTCTQNCSDGPPAVAVCGNGSVEAGEQCDDGNTRGGDGCSATCRIEPPPPPPRPTIIHPGVLQGLRISGDTQVRPNEVTQNQMIRDDVLQVDGVIELCITTGGTVGSTRLLRSTKYSGYDAVLLEAVRGWRYQPYQIDGRVVPACSTVRFVYRITR